MPEQEPRGKSPRQRAEGEISDRKLLNSPVKPSKKNKGLGIVVFLPYIETPLPLQPLFTLTECLLLL